MSDYFGLTLQSFVIYLSRHAPVTQPLIPEMLRELGVEISAGKVNQVITEVKELFEKEKEEVLSVGLEVTVQGQQLPVAKVAGGLLHGPVFIGEE